MEEKKIVEVGCAIIRHQGKLLIAQRKYGANLGGYWEFPGGKKEKEESILDCLTREVFEELGVMILPEEELCTRWHDYPERRLKLRFYLCTWVSGKPVKKDCLDFRWAAPEELNRYLFPPADRDIITEIIQKKRLYFRKGPFL